MNNLNGVVFVWCYSFFRRCSLVLDCLMCRSALTFTFFDSKFVVKLAGKVLLFLHLNDFSERLVVVKGLNLLKCLDRVNDTCLIEKFCVQLREELLFLVDFDICKLVNQAITIFIMIVILLLGDAYFFRSLVNENDLKCVFLLNDHTLLKLVEQLFVPRPQYLGFDIDESELRYTEVRSPNTHTRANHVRQYVHEHSRINLLIMKDAPTNRKHDHLEHGEDKGWPKVEV